MKFITYSVNKGNICIYFYVFSHYPTKSTQEMKMSSFSVSNLIQKCNI